MPEEVARWLRQRAADESTSVSKLVSRMLESQMQMSDGHSRAHERWKKMGTIRGINAAERLSREGAHERP